MYQGKFSSNNANQQQRNAELLAQRSQAQQSPKKLNAANTEPDILATQKTRKSAPARQASQASVQAQPVSQTQPENRVARPVKRGPSAGTVIFYTFYLMIILIFAGGTFFALNWLNGWLVKYEAAQPTVKCQQVFDELFGDPDWTSLYAMAGIEDTKFEGVTEFTAYMKDKVGNRQLTYVETSAGLSGDKKYFVCLGDERIGYFTLEGQQDKVTDIPDWKLGKVSLSANRNQSFRISKAESDVAYINGQVLGDEYTIQTASTSAEKYIPVGTPSVRSCVQSISGLLVKPTVSVQNKNGTELPVTYDEATGTFVAQTESNTITDTEKNLVINALKAYSEFMIRASGSTKAVQKYFDSSSETYKDIVNMAGELWMNKDNGHRFTEETVTDYVRYSDDLFSARGKVTMNVTLKDGGTKDYTVDMAVFFRKKNGSFVCYEMTNEDVAKPVGEVRLTFMNGDTRLDSFFVNTDASELTTPVLTAPEGKQFAGWVREDIKEDGTREYNLVFTPDENGKVNISAGTTLEPMTLLAYFESAAQAAETNNAA